MTFRFVGLLPFWTVLLVSSSLFGQSKKPEDLATGKILVSPRNWPDPLFAEAVILLARYDASGALGIMVNRRTTVPIARALREIPAAAGHSDPVFVGGPVEMNAVLALARASSKPAESTGIFGDVYLVAAKSALEKALGGNMKPGAFRVYLGYCGWAPGQLENEARRGAWYIFNRSADLAFDAEPAKLWQKLIGKTEGTLVRRNSTSSTLVR